MPIGWLTDVAEADTYFETRYKSEAWDSVPEATGDYARTAVLTTAYNRIRYHGDFSIPASPTATQLSKLKDAQCEMAYYFIIHQVNNAEDRRKGLQAQGVVGAGIVKETYDKDSLDKLPIPPIVSEILKDFYKYGESMVVIPIDRNENEDLDTDVVEED